MIYWPNIIYRSKTVKSETDREFLPLPYIPYDERPVTVPLDVEECATALYICGGKLSKAADRLKVDKLRLQRVIDRSPRLQRLHKELYEVYVHDSAEVVIDAIYADDPRVRYAAATKVLSSKAAAAHPFSPSGDGAPSLTINNDNREITFHWRKTAEAGNLIEDKGGADDAGGAGSND